MKKETIKIILVVLLLLYAASVLERLIWNRYTEKEIEAHRVEKEKYDDRIQELETKLYQHEINFIKSNAAVDAYTNEQLDSTWSTIFK